MDDDEREVRIQPIKMEFPNEKQCETLNQRNVGPQREMNDTEIETKPGLPLYNLYPMKIKEEVNDPDPSFVSLTSVVKSEPDIGQPDIQYFDHSAIIQQNLKTEHEDEDGNCEDPLYCAESVPLCQTPETSIEVLGQHSSEKIQTGEESCFRRSCKQTRTKSFTAASQPNNVKIVHTGDKKRYKCESCETSFAYNSLLTIHMKCHTGDKPFKCETCGKGFAQSAHLTRHQICHTGVKPFVCDTCGKYYKRKESLTEHMMTHNTENSFTCGTCGKHFVTKRTLADHITTMHTTGNKRFKCMECGMGFTKMSLWTRHSSTHTVEKTFKCEECSKTFRRKENLILHTKTHTGDGLFKCEECERGFARRKDLSAHMRSHTGERPFQCEQCPKSFKAKNQLTVHMMNHTGERPHRCGQCPSRFKLMRQLTIHLRTHTGDRPFKCEQCGKGLTTSCKLGKHMKTHK